MIEGLPIQDMPDAYVEVKVKVLHNPGNCKIIQTFVSEKFTF